MTRAYRVATRRLGSWVGKGFTTSEGMNALRRTLLGFGPSVSDNRRTFDASVTGVFLWFVLVVDCMDR